MKRSVCLGGLVLVGAFGLTCGCRGQKEGAPGAAQGDGQPLMYSYSAAAPEGPVVGGVAGGVVGGVVGLRAPAGQAPAVGAVPSDRKLIREVFASLEVKSLDKALASLRGAAEGAGGYVASESRSRDGHRVNRGTLTLRVNAGKLDELVRSLTSLGTVEQLRTTAGDITEEYFDLELRLNNQRRLQARLLELLNRPGNKLSDLLGAERELSRVSGEIEQMEGRRRFWDNRVALASLTVDLHEPLPAVAGGQGGAFATLKRSFSQAADNFVYAVAGIIAFTGGLIPTVIAVLLAGWMVVRAWRLRKRLRARRQEA